MFPQGDDWTKVYFSFLAFTHFKAVSSWSSALKPVANAVTRRRRQGFL